MATGQVRTNAGTPPVKKRAACDECRMKKLKCAGEQPACSRCVRENITCVYSPQKQMGRPKKRQRTEDENEQGTSNPSDFSWDFNTGLDFASSLDSQQPWLTSGEWDFSMSSDTTLPALTPDSGSANNSPPMLNLPPELQNTSHIHNNHHGHTQGDPSTQMLLDPSLTGGINFATPSCACLSSLYLTLQNLQNMDPTFPFPSALHALREAITTASEVLRCRECPTKFLSAVQNTQLVGTLIVSIAERFSKILASITAEAARAEREHEKKSLPLSSLNTSTTHLHPNSLGSCLTAFSVSLAPDEWRGLAQKVVRAEVYGPRDGNHCCASFWGLTEEMLQRQEKWHNAELPEDFPRDPVTGLKMGGSNIPKEDHLCIKLALYARKIVETSDWS